MLKKLKDFFAITHKNQNNQAGLFIPHKQTTWLTAIFLLTFSVCFLLGYFWGYKCAVDSFLITTEQESFADKINYSLYTMNDLEIGEFETKEEDTSGSDGTDTSDQLEDENKETDFAPEEQTENNENSACESLAQVVEEIPASMTKMSKVYVAPLAGFGTLQAAQAFAKRIQTIDPYVVVKKRVSKTARGKTVAWYQAITGEFSSEEDLQRVLDQLRQKEHLKDLQVIEKRKAISS